VLLSKALCRQATPHLFDMPHSRLQVKHTVSLQNGLYICNQSIYDTTYALHCRHAVCCMMACLPSCHLSRHYLLHHHLSCCSSHCCPLHRHCCCIWCRHGAAMLSLLLGARSDFGYDEDVMASMKYEYLSHRYEIEPIDVEEDDK